MQYKQGDIVLVPFPYTDANNYKTRPVVILSTQSYTPHNTYIVAKISTVLYNDSHSISLGPSMMTAPLLYPSEIRANELASVHETRIQRKVSELTPESIEQILEKIKTYFEIE